MRKSSFSFSLSVPFKVGLVSGSLRLWWVLSFYTQVHGKDVARLVLQDSSPQRFRDSNACILIKEIELQMPGEASVSSPGTPWREVLGPALEPGWENSGQQLAVPQDPRGQAGGSSRGHPRTVSVPPGLHLNILIKACSFSCI